MYVVLFDIDGTLVKTGGAGQTAFLDTFREDLGVTEMLGDISFAGRSDRAIAEEIMRVSGLGSSEELWQRFYAGYTGRIEKALSTCQGEILPGILPLLDALKQLDHVLVGLLTGNVERGAQAKLAHYGIADRFAFGGFGDLRTDRDDIAADAWQAAARYLAARNGHTIGEVMVIGDTPNDVTCARSIGAFAVAVATGGNTSEELAATKPDLVLDDLSDTDALLAEVQAHAPRTRNLAAKP